MPIRSWRYFLIITVLPLLFLFQDTRIREPLHLAALTVLKPVLLGIQSGLSGAADFRHSVFQFWRTFKNQGELETHAAELDSKLVRYEEAVRENERLKKLLDFRNTLSGKPIAARVIGWDLSPWRRTVILDKGEKQGIKKDMAVMVPDGLVGRVLESGPRVSRAILLTDPEARVSALTDTSRVRGVVVGQGLSHLQLRYLSLDAPAAVEQTVMTSGAGGLFPKGLRVGTIENISRDPDGLHLIASVRPFVQFSKLEEVLCLESSPKG